MLTQQQYQNVVFYALRANAVLTESLRNKEALGYFPEWNLASCQSLKIKSGQWSLSINDYSSVASVDIYNQLLDIGSTWMGGIAIDPNAQTPGQTIIKVPVLIGYNEDKIPFATTDDNPTLILSNYNTVYKQLYGNNPRLDIYDSQGNYIGDEQTPPIIVYEIDDDIGSDILSITWEYPIATSGYIQISGIASSGVSGNPSGGTSGAINILFTQADLLQDGNGSWYLPLMLPIGRVPIYTSSNNISFNFTYDDTFTPARLYGFGNNDTQSILVKII